MRDNNGTCVSAVACIVDQAFILTCKQKGCQGDPREPWDENLDIGL